MTMNATTLAAVLEKKPKPMNAIDNLGAVRDSFVILKGMTGPHTITATAQPGGAITPGGALVVPTNGVPAYTITPDAPYGVVDVLVDDLPEKTSAQEVAHGAQVDVQRLVLLSASSFNHITKVPVRRVARHILGEAQRVNAAESALNEGDLAAFGELMDESHDSLRQDFKCSTAALDKLCAAMRKAGAFGARLTGAGFGGYALAAVPADKVEVVIAAAVAATGGPAFEVTASGGVEVL